MDYNKMFGTTAPINNEIRRQQVKAMPEWARHLGLTLAISGGLMFFMNNALLDRAEGLNQIRASLLSSGQSYSLGIGAGVGVWILFKAKGQGRN